MKLIGQITIAIVLAWLAITGIKLLTADLALASLSAKLPTLAPAPRQPTPNEPPALPGLAPSQPAPPPPPDRREWSLTTPDGRHYSGVGPTPPGGLSTAPTTPRPPNP